MTNARSFHDFFDLTGRVAIITGGAGLLGVKHAEAILLAGGTVVLADIRGRRAAALAGDLSKTYGGEVWSVEVDITTEKSVKRLLDKVLAKYGHVDILINNAAHNPTMKNSASERPARLESFSLRDWENDLSVGLTGAFLCSQLIGSHMARLGKGVILNIASDLSVIAPDQRLYELKGRPRARQPVKPVTYSVVKTGIVGLTRYLATYWAQDGVRVNAISPGGVMNGQSRAFIRRLCQRIPMGRMAGPDEYQGTILYLCSDASAYLTGQNIVVDGGRSCW